MVSVMRPSKCPLTVMVQSSKESLNSTFQLCFYRKHYKNIKQIKKISHRPLETFCAKLNGWGGVVLQI